MTTRDKFAETWTAITIIFRVWFPTKRQWPKGIRWTVEELESLHRARYAVVNRMMERHAQERKGTFYDKPI